MVNMALRSSLWGKCRLLQQHPAVLSPLLSYSTGQSEVPPPTSRRRRAAAAAVIAGIGVGGTYLYWKREDFGLSDLKLPLLPAAHALSFTREKSAVAPPEDVGSNLAGGEYRAGLPTYTMDDVQKHASEETGYWCTFNQGVYDFTKFVKEHPGGDKILLAAGASTEPFWLLYAIHKSPHVYEKLESLRIGNLAEEDVGVLSKDLDDPYASEPRRHPALRPRSKKPFNAEPVPSLLAENFITPNDLFYVRNHLPVPNLIEEEFELEIEGIGMIDVVLTMNDLRKFPRHTITATIQCAGNRRTDINKLKSVKGLPWGFAAISNAKWTGVKLRDVLLAAGINETNPKIKHVHLEGYDVDPTNSPYAVSIPIHKALDPSGDVLLAYEMNGAPLSRDHGYPVRVVVPGTAGARNVKWLNRIVVSDEESDSHWQQKDYKSFSSSTDWDNVDYKSAPAIQEMPVQSAICDPLDGDTVTVKKGKIKVRGYAWSGGGRKVIRVDVTSDGGKNWHSANLEQDGSVEPQAWSWTLWEVYVPVPSGEGSAEIWVKAVDSAYNTQPANMSEVWNLRGLIGNAYHRITVKLDERKTRWW